MEDTSLSPIENGDKKERDEKGRFVEGWEGGPGRPQGSLSIKTKIKQIFEQNPERYEEFVDKLIEGQPGLVWQMLEGKPPQDLNLGANPELPFLIKVIEDHGIKGESS